MLKKLILKILYIILTIKLSFGQFYNTNFLKLGYDWGLTSINIKCVVKDKYGFVWVGTQDGLFKFVGNTFAQIPGHAATSNLPGNDVVDIKTGVQGNILWVAFSRGGIVGIDVASNIIKYSVKVDDASTAVSRWIKCIEPVSDQEIWIGTDNGLLSFNTTTNQLSSITVSSSGLNFNTNSFSAIVGISKSDFLLFIENKGIIHLNLTNKSRSIYFAFQAVAGKQVDRINHVFFDQKKNTCWLSSYSGLYNLNVSDPNQIYYSSDFLSEKDKYFFQQVTYSVQTDNDNNLWVCNEKGVFRIDQSTHQIMEVKSGENTKEAKWETSGNVIKIYKNEIWIGTWTGLYLSNIQQSPFHSIYFDAKNRVRLEHVYHIFLFDSLNIYACGEKEFYECNLARKSIRILDDRSYYSYLYKIPGHGYLVSKLNGLFFSSNLSKKELIPASEKFKELHAYNDFIIGSSTNYKNSITVFGSDNAKGVLVWDKRKKKVIKINTSSDSLTLKDDIVNNVFIDKKSNLIILGDNYITVIDSTLTTVQTKKMTDSVTAVTYNLFFDIIQIGLYYYIATYGKGILITDDKFNIIGKIDVNNGLSNNSIYRLIGQDNEIWASTNFGINKIQLKPFTIRKYFEEDGIHSNICEEYSSAHVKGKMIFGGLYGFTIIDQSKVTLNTVPPILYYVNIQIDKTKENEVTKINTSLLESDKYTIPSNWLQTNISFVGLNYTNPNRVTYQYRILQQDTNWIDLNTQNFVNLIGLDPGTYTLEVKAANEDGYWSPVKQLILTFEPKWFQTWWFYTLLTIVIATILYAFFRYRINQIRKQHQLRKDIASDLHDDIGSSLNTVKIFTHLAKKESDKEPYLNEIESSLTSATTGLRDMLWVLDDSQDTAFELVERIRKFVLPVLQASNIRLDARVEADEHKALSKAEKKNLYLIAKESINNSIKYADCKNISLHIHQANGKTAVLIQDDGKGFDTSKQPEGNGLKNIHERARQIHYLVNITSSPEKGTAIKLMKK